MAVPFFDASRFDASRHVMSREQIYSVLPQRHEFEVLDAVTHLDPAAQEIIAFKDFTTHDWWVKGHLPGRPLVPGIVMVEAAAQTASLLMRAVASGWRDKFIGFGGLDQVRFRGMITPPARLWLTAKGGSFRSSLAKMPVQGFVDEKMVFDGEVLGVLV
jgi:3-hydroxyacyl-[acyl-carrier-protein] dehydratase